MELLKIILIALLQGIAEFLPISSSGHVVLLADITGFSAGNTALLNAVVHAGTLVAILIYYFKTIFSIVVDVKKWRIIALVAVASIPAAAAGLTLKFCGMDEVLNRLPVVAAGFFVSAAILWTMGRPMAEQLPDIKKLSFLKALVIGLGQMIAIIPGISRAGTTISVGQRMGLSGNDAATFSFLMGAVVIGGPFLLELPDIIGAAWAPAAGEMIPWWHLAVAFAVAGFVGYISLRCLIRILDRGKLQFFAWYLLLAGTAAVVLTVCKYI
jgi:undecaprenyl-diphosphatase